MDAVRSPRIVILSFNLTLSSSLPLPVILPSVKTLFKTSPPFNVPLILPVMFPKILPETNKLSITYAFDNWTLLETSSYPIVLLPDKSNYIFIFSKKWDVNN